MKPNAQAQMEGTTSPLFVDIRSGGKGVYWHGHQDVIRLTKPVDLIQAICFRTRAELARIVAESRRR